MLIGVAYHPEHWTPERWREDARLMKDAGLNAVRMGEFAWSQLEPIRNKFRFRWLEDAVNVFADAGIRSVLCTPTACPPPWLVERHPSILPTDASGQRLGYGACRSYCVNNPSQHKYAQRIASALAEHFRSCRNVVAWQADSGFARFGTARCFCRNCAQGFRTWLQRKYSSVENLNARCGTRFWSHEYTDWQQIPLPGRAVGNGTLAHNPALLLDFARFCSDSWVAYQRLLVETLRAICPGIPVTHNLPASVTDIDPFSLAADLDFVTASLSDGAQGYGADPRLFMEMLYALKGRRFWAADVDDVSAAAPQQFRQMFATAYAALARGAEALFFSRWRPAPFGADQLRPGLLNHDGSPGLMFEAVARLARSLPDDLDPLLRAPADADAALVVCHESAWALRQKPQPDVDYWGLVAAVYAALARHTSRIAVIRPEAALAPYKLIVVPALYLLREDAATRLSNYLAKGGRLLVTCMSGVKDGDNNVWTTGLPAGLQAALGISVRSFTRLPDGDHGRVRVTATNRLHKTCLWHDHIEPAGARTLAVYADGPLKGLPAVTAHANGSACYIGAQAEPDLYDYFLALACRDAGIAPLPFTGDGVEAMARGNVLFLINQSFEPRPLTLDGFYEDTLRGTRHKGQIELPPDGALVLKKIG